MLVAYAQRRTIVAMVVVSMLLVTFVWAFLLLPGLGEGSLPPIPMLSHAQPSAEEVHDSCPNGTRRYGDSTTFGPIQNSTSKGQEPKLPEGVNRVMAMVFFGRRATVSILDCYLKVNLACHWDGGTAWADFAYWQRNLKKNGGVLDGVIFLERTSDDADLKFLDKLLASEADYEKVKIEMDGNGYSSSYDFVQDDVMYIKIDDDIVFIEDTVIPSLVATKSSHPELFVVSANVVNQPLISWIHWNLGAIRPYLPELNKAYPWPKNCTKLDWRPSLLPGWQGNDNFQVKDWSPPNHQRHRWLPIRGKEDHILDQSPIVQTEYDAFGPGLMLWQVAAQEHMSLLENIESGELGRYRFRMWDFQLKRMGIQFICILGRDINLAKPMPADDEHHIAVAMPERTGRHAVADGAGVVAHYAFGPQSGDEKIAQTDILDRYRAYAEEFVCANPMLWEPDMDEQL